MARLNKEQQSILAAYQNGTLERIAELYTRINERGFTYNWTFEQHLERLTKQAQEIVSEQSTISTPTAKAPYYTRLGNNSNNARPQPGTADYDLFCDHGE